MKNMTIFDKWPFSLVVVFVLIKLVLFFYKEKTTKIQKQTINNSLYNKKYNIAIIY